MEILLGQGHEWVDMIETSTRIQGKEDAQAIDNELFHVSIVENTFGKETKKNLQNRSVTAEDYNRWFKSAIKQFSWIRVGSNSVAENIQV